MNLFDKVGLFVYIICIVQGFKVQLPLCEDAPIWPFCPNTSRMCFCCEILETAVCSNNGANLTFIPTLPAFVKKLKFDKNNLTNVTKTTFQNLTNLNVILLSLNSNDIRSISKDAFSHLKNMKILDLSNNVQLYKCLRETLTAIAKTEVENVYLNNISFRNIHGSDLDFLNSSKVSSISLANNNVKNFVAKAFLQIPDLKKLNMSGNDISVFTLRTTLEDLRELDLSTNQLELEKKAPFCKGNKGKSRVPNLILLNLSSNHIFAIRQNTFKCLDKVKYLNMNKNPVISLPGFVFKHLKSLSELNLGDLHQLENIDDDVFAKSKLKVLAFSTSNFNKIITGKEHIFKYCRDLSTLDLSGTPIPRSYTQLNVLLNPLKNLENLYLRNVGFKAMPSYLFSMYVNLENLYLDKNKIESWNGSEVFGNVRSLKTLHLDDNKISIMSEKLFTKQLLKSLKIISFANNPLQCSCENKWLRDFIRKRNGIDTRVVDFQYYKCSDKSLFQNYNPTENDCKVIDYVLICVVTVCAILIVFLLTSGFAYKMRWHIRYRLYLIRNYKNGYKEIANGSKYGAYVIYSSADKDRIWVHKELIPRLEKKHNIKLCIRMRDFAAGGVIMDTMVESLNQSSKVILVLSNNFVKCDWCKFQLTLLHDRLIAEGRSILLLINFKTINVDNMNDYLHWLITSNTHFNWSKDKMAKRLFWEQLVTALNLPNENQGLDFQNEKDIPNPLKQSFAARPCIIL